MCADMVKIVIPRSELCGKYFTASVLLVLFLVLGSTTPASAHTTIEVENIEIDVGWGIEPPIVGYRNDFVFKISELGETEGVRTGIKNAFKNLEVTAKYGGVTKVLDIGSDPRPGHYYSHVIPTKTGSISIDLKGEVEGIQVDVQVPIEDVETTAILDFPPSSGSSSNTDVAALKNAISQIQRDVNEIRSGSGIEIKSDTGRAYDFAVFGLSLGAAGVVLAIVSLTKRGKLFG